jgi:hypothetical protein
MSEITLRTFLREVARDVYSDSSKRIAAKLSHKLTTRQCYVLHSYAIGEEIDGEYRPSRQNLVKLGFVHQFPCPNGTRGLNKQIKIVYRLTDLGEAAHREMVEKLTPIVERCNQSRKEVTA